jgi:leader peptidase (prepilin peptidase) / N-methyltransferase
MSVDHVLGILYAALLGGAFGSFANVLILRWHEDASLLGRSACPHCKSRIPAKHLIPILSWLWLKGRCASCARAIHAQYILVEVAAVLLAVIAALRFNPFDLSVASFFWFEFFVTIALLVPVAMDVRWKELPVEYLIGVGTIAFLARVAFSGDPWSVIASTCIALAATTIFFGLQILLSRGAWLGMGDVWFGVAMAGILGWPLVGIAVYLAYLIGGVIALAGLSMGTFRRKSRIAFGPMLAVGTLCAIWLSETLLHWVGIAYG